MVGECLVKVRRTKGVLWVSKKKKNPRIQSRRGEHLLWKMCLEVDHSMGAVHANQRECTIRTGKTTILRVMAGASEGFVAVA
jgi:hypothetical protein